MHLQIFRHMVGYVKREIGVTQGMQMEEIMERIVEICQRHAVRQTVLFGSRAKGTALERSDIDIAVSGAEDFRAVQEEMEELPTLYKIDVVNLDTCTNKELVEDIEKYGKKIYEKISIL